MTKQQAEDLPEFKESTTLNYEYEEQVRSVYRTQDTASSTRTGARS